MKTTVPIEKAQEMAKASGLESVIKRVEKAVNDGWAAITLEAVQQPDGTWDIGATAPTGVMVAWMLPEWTAEKVAIPGGEPASDLHVTLIYLGDEKDLTLDKQHKLIGAVSEVCSRHHYMEGSIGGTGRFVNGEDTDPFWVGVNIPKLLDLRKDLAQALTDAGIPPAGKGDELGEYTPHITVAYLPKDQPNPPMVFKPEQVSVSTITVCVGPNRFKIELPFPETDLVYQPGGWAPEVINKAIDAVEEERFTLGPWYIPDQLDAHGEYTDARELQKSFHEYLAKEDRGIRLQHNKAIVAGKWVSGMVMPHEYTTTLTKADGTTEEHTFPAGTPFLGVVWEEWAWPLVKAGKIRGYSIGGTSKRMLVDLPKEK